MVGADPKFQIRDRADRITSPGTQRHARPAGGAGSLSLRCLCRCPSFWFNAARRPAPACWPRTAQATAGDSFEDRFPQPQFNDRFPTASESLRCSGRSRWRPPQRTVRTEPVRVASLNPHADASAPDRARRTDHAGQHEILRLPLFRQQSALRRAVPQYLQGRAARAIAAMAAGSTGRTRPTTTTACWCTSPRLSTPASPA